MSKMATSLQRALGELRRASFQPRCRTALQFASQCRRCPTLIPSHSDSKPCYSTQSHLNASSAPASFAHSSIDASEVSHFDALASSWWDLHGPSRLLHLMNPLRHEFIARCKASAPPSTIFQPDVSEARIPKALETDQGVRHQGGLDFLDIGCGGGIFAESAARLQGTASVTAIDPSAQVLDVARRHAKRDPKLMQPGKLTYLETSVEGLADMLTAKKAGSKSPTQFDVVTLFEVIEHIRYPSPFLSLVLPFVKPGGWIIGSTIARTWASWLTTKVVAEDIVGIVPRGTHDWDKYINPTELRDWFECRSAKGEGRWDSWTTTEVAYIPGLGWRDVKGVQGLGNYFFGVRKAS